MHKFLFSLIVIFLISVFDAEAQRHCGHEEQLAQWIRTDSASVAAFYGPRPRIVQPRTMMTIPVVVHIVYASEDENISDFQVESQIEAMNRFFGQGIRASNEARSIHGDVFALPSLRFQLACVDPEGQPTTGITRTQTNIEEIGFHTSFGQLSLHYDNLGGKSGWPPADYMNLWVCAFEEGFLGRAFLPEMLPSPEVDGPVIHYQNFGYAGSAYDASYYDLGMTAIHEIGHYLGLLHPWGGVAENCEMGDFIEDTPDQSEIYYGCPRERRGNMTCGSVDMVNNVMGYADDACLTYFTKQQSEVMEQTLLTLRSSLLSSPALGECSNVRSRDDLLFWHHVEQDAWVMDLRQPEASAQFRLYNMVGQPIMDGVLEDPSFIRISLAGLPAGMYVIHVEDSRGVIERKVLSLGR